MELKCSCGNSCEININNLKANLNSNEPCDNCKIENIKKFKSIDEQFSLKDIDNNFRKCVCGKRSLDTVMVHVLKIMMDEGIDVGKKTLRNGPVPLINPLYKSNNPPFIGENSLIILDNRLNENYAKKIIKDVEEVKGVLKGSSNNLVGMKDKNSKPSIYKLLSGCDIRCDILKTEVGEIAINKSQHLSYIEFPQSIENKIIKLSKFINEKYLTKKEIANLSILDGTCGNGSLGIFLLKYGVGNVVFNDIWKPSALSTCANLKSNGFKPEYLIKNADFSNLNPYNSKIAIGNNFDVYNLAIENLKENLDENDNYKFDICILDCFPSVDINNFKKIADSLADDVLII